MLLLSFAALLLLAVLVSHLAHRTILSTAVVFLVGGFVLGPACSTSSTWPVGTIWCGPSPSWHCSPSSSPMACGWGGGTWGRRGGCRDARWRWGCR
ncbi:MAG: hypothetical protein R2731_10135 [Nocardioides sp.]